MDFYYYLTRARSEPASDPVKPLIGHSVSGFVHATSEKLRLCSTSFGIFCQRFHEHLVRPSMPVSIPSQITVDCKSVHCNH